MREFFVGRDAEVLAGEEGEDPGIKIWRTHMEAAEFGHMACVMDENLYLLWIKDGDMVCQINQEMTKLQEGEGLFVNAGQAWRLVQSENGCSFILMGMTKAYIKEAGKEMVLSVTRSDSAASLKIEIGTEYADRLLQCLCGIESAAKGQKPGWKIEIKGLAFCMWVYLYRRFKDQHAGKKPAALREANKLRGMLIYLHEHYQEKLTLAQMAAASSVSTGEYCRFFKKRMHQTPVEYLQIYRIEQSLPKILKKSGKMPEIAASCGFAGSSYYSETFKKEMGCTPGEYRKWYRGELQGECPLKRKHTPMQPEEEVKAAKGREDTRQRENSMPAHLL